jgi:ParB/RepB/Spo0J family partition protein
MTTTSAPTPQSAPPVPTTIELVELDRIVPNPHQPRRFKDDSAKVAELAESIRRHGVRQAILLRPVNGHLELVFGERRVRACRLLGQATVPGVVDATMTEDEAFRLLMAENLQREDLDPIEESQAFEQMKARGWTLEDIAAESGRSVRYVARRAKLADLVDDWRAAVADPKSKVHEWTPAHLELIARFDAEQQRKFLAALAKEYWVETWQPKRLRAWLASQYNLLADAPWTLDDAALCPKLGACDGCPKRSDANPELFDDADWSAGMNGHKPKAGARCLDVACWKKKTGAHVDATIKALHTKHPDLHVYQNYGEKTPKGLPVVSSWNTEKAKKGAKNAVPAAKVHNGHVEIEWIKKPKKNEVERAGGAGCQAARASKPDPAAELDLKRKTWVCNKVAEEIEALVKAGLPAEVCTPRIALALVCAFGYEAPYGTEKSDWEAYEKACERPEQDLARECVKQVLELVAGNISHPASYNVLSSCDEARDACIFLGINFKAIEAEGIREIPEPAATGSKVAKKRGKKPAAKPAVTPGVCRVCGCTETNACDHFGQPCHWVDEEETLCSSCADEAEGDEAEGAAAEDAE